MSRLRVAGFAGSAAILAALLVAAVTGLPGFGTFSGAYGELVNRLAVPARHTSNVVTTVVFDVRGIDTLGEELILFASVIAVALVLRETRPEEAERAVDRAEGAALRVWGLGALAPALVAGLWVVAYGTVTPGGGFQGGVLLAGALALVYLAGSYRGFSSAAPLPLVEPAEGVGAGALPAVGVAALASGASFLANVLPYGTAGTLASGGTIAVLNAATGLAVAAAFALLFAEFLEELMVERAG